jgi:hypothetical protein
MFKRTGQKLYRFIGMASPPMVTLVVIGTA